MISVASLEFLRAYTRLDPETRRKVRRAHQLFKHNPRHGGLQFKRVRGMDNVYSARIDNNYRALGELRGNVITWYWVGPHDEYERMIG